MRRLLFCVKVMKKSKIRYEKMRTKKNKSISNKWNEKIIFCADWKMVFISRDSVSFLPLAELKRKSCFFVSKAGSDSNFFSCVFSRDGCETEKEAEVQHSFLTHARNLARNNIYIYSYISSHTSQTYIHICFRLQEQEIIPSPLKTYLKKRIIIRRDR